MSCETDSSTDTQVPKTDKKAVTIPRFEKDSAYTFVKAQVGFGHRIPNTAEHKACKEWLVSKLKKFGASVLEQDFQAKAYTGTTLNGTNIIASFNPNNKKRILLAAHWDTRHIAEKDPDSSKKNQPIFGADDGASGVGVLLEVARQLHLNPIDLGVDIILFDAEDHGEGGEEGNPLSWCMGSQHWSRNMHVSSYRPKYGILLDMVGSKGARFPKEGFSRQYANNIVNKVWKLANSMGYGNYFVNENADPKIDDHLFVNRIAGIPMIDIINVKVSEQFGDYHHTHSDNMDIIDKRTLRATGQVVLAVVYREAGGIF